MNVSVLLLEDEPDLRDVLELAFADDGYRVVVCESPAQVIEVAKVSLPSLAVVDFWGRNQTDLSEDDRADLRQFASAVPTILTTAWPWAARETAADLGVLSIVPMPFDLDEVSTLVAAWVATLAENSARAREDARGIRSRMDGALQRLRERDEALRRLEDTHGGSSQL